MFIDWILRKKKRFSSAKPNSHRAQVDVRLEAIGGQGAHSAGKILAEAAVLGEQYTGNHFSSFGSEKRGSHVRSYIRFSTIQKPIRTASAIQNPHLLVIFHDQLILTHPEVFEGCSELTDVIINTRREIKDLQLPKNIRLNQLAILDAEKISLKYRCGINAVMLGAVSLFLHEIQEQNLQKYLDLFFQKLNPEQKKANQMGYSAGAEKIDVYQPEQVVSVEQIQKHSRLDWGWLNAPIGGVILESGNSYIKDNSASRKGSAPVLNREICFHCGFCDMVCPDFCFVWDIDPQKKNKPELQGIDYQYCKGCQKCITVCPVQALELTPESEIPDNEKKYHLFKSAGENSINPGQLFYKEELSEQEMMQSPLTELLNEKSYLSELIKNSDEWEKHLTPEMKSLLKERMKK